MLRVLDMERQLPLHHIDLGMRRQVSRKLLWRNPLSRFPSQNVRVTLEGEHDMIIRTIGHGSYLPSQPTTIRLQSFVGAGMELRLIARRYSPGQYFVITISLTASFRNNDNPPRNPKKMLT